MKKKILLIGGSGLLGINWAIYQRKKYQIYIGLHSKFISIKNTESFYLNFENYKETKKKILEIEPNYIINLSGLVDVEKCQNFKKLAFDANVKIPKKLAKIAAILNCKLLHISTDHLFFKGKPFKSEISKVSLTNYYAKTKFLGEKMIKNIHSNYLIVRTNFFGYGSKYKKSYSDYILETIHRKKILFLSNNIYFNPIYIKNLINTCDLLIEKNSIGIFNISADDRLSKYNFGIKLVELSNSKDLSLEKIKLLKNNNKLIKRPLEMSLNNNKVKKTLNIKIGSIEENILMMLEDKDHKKRIIKLIK